MIPARWRIYVQAVADLGGVSDPIVAQACRLLESDKASRRKRREAPRVVRRRATKEQRQANWQTVKEAVAHRTRGRCELCEASGSDAHHLLSGPLRRKYETPATVACLCRFCHDAIHSGNRYALEDAAALAARIGAPDIVLAALNRRIQKANHVP